MKKLSRSKLRQAARLAMAIHGYDLLQGFNHSAIGLSEEEHAIMSDEANKIAERLAGNHPMNLGSVDACIEYFKNK